METTTRLSENRSRLATLGRLAALCTLALGCHQMQSAPISESYPRSARGDASADSASAAGAPSAYAEKDAAAERPGLGTVWGENRYSPVRDVAFERYSDSPTFLASLNYNDVQGTEAMRNRIGRRYGGDEAMLRAFAPGRLGGLWAGVVVRVVDEEGQPLPAYHLDERVLLVGESGQRYALEIENHTGQRYEVVASVDGLDVVDGSAAGLNKRGYVLSPHGRLHIDGFRRSMSQVAAFRFGSVRDSYAAKTADFGDRHVGVIGFALFAERGYEPPMVVAPRNSDLDDEAARREAADPFPNRFANPPARSYY